VAVDMVRGGRATGGEEKLRKIGLQLRRIVAHGLWQRRCHDLVEQHDHQVTKHEGCADADQQERDEGNPRGARVIRTLADAREVVENMKKTGLVVRKMCWISLATPSPLECAPRCPGSS
jgi:hypothetical protein